METVTAKGAFIQELKTGKWWRILTAKLAHELTIYSDLIIANNCLINARNCVLDSKLAENSLLKSLGFADGKQWVFKWYSPLEIKTLNSVFNFIYSGKKIWKYETCLKLASGWSHLLLKKLFVIPLLFFLISNNSITEDPLQNVKEQM